MMKHLALTWALVAALAACSRGPDVPATGADTAASAPTAAAAGTEPRPAGLPLSKVADEPLPPVESPYDVLPKEMAAALDTPFTGDFDEMVKRRLIRVGTVFNRTHYFIDPGVQRGVVAEAFKRFEEDWNAKLKTGLLKAHVVVVPLARDQLFPALQAGKVDLVSASLTITPGRLQHVDFCTPTKTNVSEIVVTGPGVPKVTTPEDLSGREVFVRKSSSYYESLVRLNESLAARKRPLVSIKEAPEALEDDDVLEMVNAGLIDVTVMDDFMVEFWRQVFPAIQPQPVSVRTGGELAAGVRKNNPQLRAAVNEWIKEVGPRSAFFNILARRYVQSTKYVKNAASDAERKKLQTLVKFFETYAGRYKVDYVLMAAQGYQESQLDHSVRSPVGAIGVMQVMPATGKDLAVGDITQLEPNIHAGVKYFRFMMDEFYKDEPMDDMKRRS
jgi:membrane-bound lytic murein transglycosylase MltF